MEDRSINYYEMIRKLEQILASRLRHKKSIIYNYLHYDCGIKDGGRKFDLMMEILENYKIIER